MAYGNYGAYIWKNGKEMTSVCADRAYEYRNSKWQLEDEDHTDTDMEETKICAYSHAVIPIDDNILLEFYKTHMLDIYINDKKENIDIEKKILNKARYTHRKSKVTIMGYALDSDNSIFFYEIKYKNDTWCVIIGSSFGRGYDHYKISKYVKKHIIYHTDEDEAWYYIKHKSEYEFDYYCRQSEIQHIRSMRWYFGIKTLIKDIFKLKGYSVAFDIREIIKYNNDIKYLK